MRLMDSRKRVREYLSGPSGKVAPSCATPIEAALIEHLGFDAIHVSGNAVHKGLGLPDAGLVTLPEMADRVRSIADVTSLPIVVDGETGFGSARNVLRTVRALERAGAAAIHLEDQVTPRRARDIGKTAEVISPEEMVDKLKAALDAREDPNLAVIARCEDRTSDAALVDRLVAYAEAGVDALWSAAFGAAIIDPIKSQVGAKPFVGVPVGRRVSAEAVALGVRIMCFPTALALGAAWGAAAVLRDIKDGKTPDEAYGKLAGLDAIRTWYRDLGEDRFKS
jgi:2-methylisocitrate lyase-like PEP mutase family enzyme